MDVSLLSNKDYQDDPKELTEKLGEEGKVEKMGEVAKFSVMDQSTMEVVDMRNNEHYMLLVDAQATLRSIEPQLKVELLCNFNFQSLAKLNDDMIVFLIFESKVLSPGDYLHSIITESNNTFYMLCVFSCEFVKV